MSGKGGTILLFALLASIASAGYEYLPYDMTLTWQIGDVVVYFNLSIAIIRTTYIDWWGIGLKSMDGANDMSQTDITLISKAGLLTDRWATNNTTPDVDSAYGGRNSLTYLFSKVIDGYYVTAWYRKKDTSDDYDLLLSEGSTYKILWAVGKTDDNGALIQHSTGKRGIEVLTLTNDYVDDGSDDAVLANSSGAGLTLSIVLSFGLW